ncbi:MAG: class I SAM-dependent RNA methyltransferase [Microbacteriaceae bacterium]
MGEWLGHDVELTPTGIAHGGYSVARLDGRVVFVSDAIPGETVIARVTDDSKSSFWWADTVSVVNPSEHRVPHIWHEADVSREPERRVGGADFGHIALAHQRELKKDVLRDALVRFGKVDPATVSLLLGKVEALPGDDTLNGLGWRTRVRLHTDDRGHVGPRARKSHDVIRVSSLPLATTGVNEIAPLSDEYGNIGSVDVLSPSIGDPRLIVGNQKPTVIREKVGNREFRVDDNGFWQVHREAPVALSSAIRDAIDPDRFDATAYNLDLYGGVGLFAAVLADLGGSSTRVTSVEANDRATEHAGENLAEWVGAMAETAKVDRWLSSLDRRATPVERTRLEAATVVLDPPRTGAGREVMSHLARLAPAQLVYVACDPVALARDVAFASAAGYRLSKITALDMFPHTHHVEAVATLVREDRRSE